MKLLNAMKNVDKSKENTCDADIDTFLSEFNLSFYDGEMYNKFAERVKVYWLVKWLCTDTWVGIRVYYFDDEPVAVSRQTARKSDELIDFVSKETADQLREFILSLDNEQSFNLIDEDEEIDSYYTVSHGSQLLTKTGYYNGEEVEKVREYGYESPYTEWHNIDVKLADGRVEKISLDDFHIPIHINKIALIADQFKVGDHVEVIDAIDKYDNAANWNNGN